MAAGFIVGFFSNNNQGAWKELDGFNIGLGEKIGGGAVPRWMENDAFGGDAGAAFDR